MTTADAIALAAAVGQLFTPLAVVGVAIFFERRFKQIERQTEIEHRLSTARLEIYKDVGFQINDIVAYFTHVGHWKDKTPPQILKCKRELDRHFYTFQPLFSEALFRHYNVFIGEAFLMFGGWGTDAKLRTSVEHRPEETTMPFADCLTGENNKSAIRNAYRKLMDCLASDLGVSKAKAYSA